MLDISPIVQNEEKKILYDYQKNDIDAIFERMDNTPSNYHLLYQLPTGGGKTVIFSEIVRRYLEYHDKKVVVLTHRIELCKQTSKILKGFNKLRGISKKKLTLVNIPTKTYIHQRKEKNVQKYQDYSRFS
jgi:superfamily II DNA or RNA helicase